MMQVWVVVPKNFFIATVGEEKVEERGVGGSEMKRFGLCYVFLIFEF